MVINTTLKLNFFYTFCPLSNTFPKAIIVESDNAPQTPHNPYCRNIADSVDHLANTAESPSDGISGGSEGTAAGLEKDLPAEEKIPTH